MKRLADVLVPAILILSATAALAAKVLPVLEPATETVPWTAGAAGLLLLVWLFRRRTVPRTTALGCALVAATLAVGFGPVGWRAASLPRPSGQAADLRVMSLNVWFENRETRRTLELIRAYDPDILILTEAGEAVLEQLSRELPDHPFRYTCEKMPYCGVAILSRLPGRALPGGADLSDGLTRPPGDWGVIPSAAAEFRHADGEWFPVVAVHLLRRGGLSADSRSIEEALRIISGLEHPERAILAGDFNASDWSWGLRRIDESIGLQRRTFGVRTWPSPSSPVRERLPLALFGIDHVLAGDTWETISVRRGPDVGSDHYPVLSAFRKVGERRPGAGE